jgi:hypothetical protein
MGSSSVPNALELLAGGVVARQRLPEQRNAIVEISNARAQRRDAAQSRVQRHRQLRLIPNQPTNQPINQPNSNNFAFEVPPKELKRTKRISLS